MARNESVKPADAAVAAEETPLVVDGAVDAAAVAGEPEMVIADGLVVKWIDIAAAKEQDVNAQQMQPRHFDRLTENIHSRGMLESLPYCHQPGGQGTVSVISGHHRVRASRAAGLSRIPAIVDLRDMTQSQIVSKQIAHNELHGEPDQEILRQLVAMMDNVDDLLASGLDESHLPVVEPDDTRLLIPHAEFDWRMVTLTFLPEQLRDFTEIISMIEGKSEIVGVAPVESFQEFSKALLDYSRVKNIKSMSAVVYTLTKIAREQVEEHEAAERAAAEEPAAE